MVVSSLSDMLFLVFDISILSTLTTTLNRAGNGTGKGSYDRSFLRDI